MDRLQRSHFLDSLSGEVYLSHYQAMQALAPELEMSGVPELTPAGQGAVG